MFFNIGGGEILVIAMVALIAVGPEQLPSLIRRVGRIVAQLKAVTSDLRDEFMSGLDDVSGATDPTTWGSGTDDDPVVPRGLAERKRASVAQERRLTDDDEDDEDDEDDDPDLDEDEEDDDDWRLSSDDDTPPARTTKVWEPSEDRPTIETSPEVYAAEARSANGSSSGATATDTIQTSSPGHGSDDEPVTDLSADDDPSQSPASDAEADSGHDDDGGGGDAEVDR